MDSPSLEEAMTAPLASCIMPTRDRRAFVPEAIRCFLAQDYAPRELVILDDGEDPVEDCIPSDPRIRYIRHDRRLSVGAKRNALCREARGEFILHWDDDDWYPGWRTRRQMEALEAPNAAVSGTSIQYFYEPSTGRAWRFQYVGAGAYVTGATLAYRRSFWQSHAFDDVQVGEDTKFVQSIPRGKIVDLAVPSLCIGTIHGSNVSPKWPVGPAWMPVEPSVVRALRSESTADRGAPPVAPTTSCIMPTSNRRAFVPLALELFSAQRGVSAELIVVDSGNEPVEDLCQGIASVRYVRAQPRTSIGAQRNLACAQARGEVIAHWDDDDWYGPDRLQRQLEPIMSGRADVTGLENRYTLNLLDGSFWTTTPELHRRMFVGDVHGGTLAYRRSLLGPGIRYLDVNLAEDAALLTTLLRGGARLERVPNDGVFVYMRHGRNAWRFDAGAFVDPAGWSRTDGPATLPAATLARYRSLGGAAIPSAAAPVPAEERWLDCLGRTQVILPRAPLELERCVAFVATESHAPMLDGALETLGRFGGLPDVPRVVFVDEQARTCASIAARHGAIVIQCRFLGGPGPSIKGVLYSMARVVKAKQYLCLDADVLVLDTLAPLFARHAALGSGKVLIAAEATAVPVAHLRDALVRVYQATPGEAALLLGSDPRVAAEPHVVNDGVFVADFEALSAIDALLRGDEAIRAWVSGRRDVWWRQKGAFNVALARLGAIAPLEGAYNAQLHIEPATKRTVDGRARAHWRGELASVLHFNGRGREAHAVWRGALDRERAN